MESSGKCPVCSDMLLYFVVDASLDTSIKCNAEGCVLHHACDSEDPEIIQVLLDEPGLVTWEMLEERDSVHGYSSVSNACMNPNQEILNLIAQKFPQILKRSILTMDGESALHLACENENVEILRFILKSYDATDLNRLLSHKTHDFGYTPLHCACNTGNPEVIKLLIETCYPISQCKDDDHTALMIVDNDGDTPLDLCCQEFDDEPYSYHFEHAITLIAAGASPCILSPHVESFFTDIFSRAGAIREHYIALNILQVVEKQRKSNVPLIDAEVSSEADDALAPLSQYACTFSTADFYSGAITRLMISFLL